jgi:Ca2+-binding RTX toxin-like protein
MAIIEGTGGNDYLVGISGNDTFKGSTGNDTIEGIGTGNTVDYRKDPDAAVLLKIDGTVSKNALKANYGQDKLINIQKVIGGFGSGLLSSFDASTVTNGYSEIDLQSGSVTVRDRTANSVFNITLEQFQSVSGTGGSDRVLGSVNRDFLRGNRGNDRLVGRAGNDLLTGGSGKDILLGGSGDDVLTGTERNFSTSGAVTLPLNEKDYLVGGSGADTFVLGDSIGSYYIGDNDLGYAYIKDFSAIDNISLAANQAYVTRKTEVGFNLFAKSQTGALDLISVVVRDPAGANSGADPSDAYTISDLNQLKIDLTIPPGIPSVAAVSSMSSRMDLNSFDPFTAEGLQEFTIASGQKIGNFVGV